MARNVGSIEVTVDADTGKLKAQIVRASKEAGEAGGEAIEEGLSDIDSRELMAKIHKIKADIQRAMAGIEAEIELEADIQSELKRIQAAVKAAQIELTLTPELDDADLQELLSEVRVKLADAVELEVDTVLDEAQAREVVLEAQAALDLAEAEIDVRLGISEAEESAFKAELRTALAEAELEAEEIDIDLNVELRTALALAEGEALRDEIDALEAEIEVNLDTEQATLDLFGFKARTEADDIELAVDTHILWTRVRADRAALEATFRDIHPDVEPDFDLNSQATAALEAKMAGWATDTGDDAGSKFGSSFGGGMNKGLTSSFSDLSQFIVTTVMAFGADLYPILEGGIGAITALVSSAASAIGGVSALGLVSIAGLVATAAATFIGFEGFGGAISAINDEFDEMKNQSFDGAPVATALSNLAPNAMLAAIAFAGIRQGLADSREEIQQELFTGFDGIIREFATSTLPSLTDAAVIAAGSVNELVVQMAEVAENVDWVETMKTLDPTIDTMFDAATDLAGVLVPMLEAAAPASLILALGIKSATGDFKEWVNANPQKLEDFFTNGATSLLLWAGLLASVSGLLATIFDAGLGEGDSFITDLDNMIAKWDGWLESVEGQTALDEFFAGADETLAAMEPVVTGLKELVQILGEESGGESFSDLMQSLGDALPAIGEALALIADLGIGQLFLDLFAAMGPVFDLLNSMPDKLLELVGAGIAAYKIFGMMKNVFGPLNAALGFFNRGLADVTKANPYLLALAAAVTAVALGVDWLSGSNAAAEEATAAFSDSLEANVQSLIDTQSALEPATVAAEALAASFAEGDIGQNLITSLGKLNSTVEEMAPHMQALGEGGEAALAPLEQLARSAGLPEEAIKRLAAAVNNTDDNFANMADAGDDTGEALRRLSYDMDLPIESLLEVAAAMEKAQDQAENVHLDEVALDALSLARGTDGATKAMLEASLAAEGLAEDAQLEKLSTEQLLAVYEEYVSRLYAVQGASAGVYDANGNLMSSYDLVQGSIQLATLASEEQAAALDKERDAAFQAWEAEKRLAKEIERGVSSYAFDELGVPPEVTEGFGELGEAVREAEEAASDFASTYDTLFGGFLGWQEAISGMEQAFDDLEEAVKGVKSEGSEEEGPEMFEGWDTRLLPAIDGIRHFNTEVEAGQELLAQNAALAQSIIEAGVAGLEEGIDADVVLGEMNRMRDAWEEQLVAVGMTVDEADAYADAVLGTPEAMETIFRTPGLLDSLLNIQDLTVLYDEADGRVIVPELEALGIDTATLDIEALMALAEELGITVTTVTVDADVDPAIVEAQRVEASMWNLDNLESTPTVSTENIEPAVVATGDVSANIFDIGGLVATPTISTAGIEMAEGSVASVYAGMSSLDVAEASPTVSVTGGADTAAFFEDIYGDVVTLDESTANPEVELLGHLITIALLGIIQGQLDTIAATAPAPSISLPTFTTVTAQFATLQLGLTLLDIREVAPSVKLDGYTTVLGNLTTLQGELGDLGRSVASPSVTLDNYTTVMTQIDNIQTNLASIRDRSVTVTTNNVSTGSNNMAGGMITYPQTVNVGERGLREAIVPLDLPLNRVNPEVRDLAAMLRGESGPSTSRDSGRSPRPINQYFTLSSADPEAVAVQTLNRAAAAANL